LVGLTCLVYDSINFISSYADGDGFSSFIKHLTAELSVKQSLSISLVK